MLDLKYQFLPQVLRWEQIQDRISNSEMEMDTDFFYLALAEDNLDDCISPEKKTQWKEIRQTDCRDDFIADARKIFLYMLRCSQKAW